MGWCHTAPWLLTGVVLFGHSKAADQSISITLVPRNYTHPRQREDFVCGLDTATESFLGEQNGPFIFGYLDNTKSQPKGYMIEVFDVLLLTKDGQPKIMMDDLPCDIDMEAPGLYALFLTPAKMQCNSRTFSDIEEAKEGYYPVFIGVSRNFTVEISRFLSDVDTFKQFYKGTHPKLCGAKLPVRKEQAVSKAHLLTGMFNILYNGEERNFDPTEDKVCRSEEETIDAMKKTELIDTTAKMWFEENNITVSESHGFAELTITRESAIKKVVGFVKTFFPASGGKINAADESDIVSYEGPILFESNKQSTNLFITIKQDEDDTEEDEAVLIQFDQTLGRSKRAISTYDKLMLIISNFVCPRRRISNDDPTVEEAICSCQKDDECKQFERCLNRDENPKNGKVCLVVDRCMENADCSRQVHHNVDSEKECLNLCDKFPPCSKRATRDHANFFNGNECTLYTYNTDETRCDKETRKCIHCQGNDGCAHLADASVQNGILKEGTPACHRGTCKQCNAPGKAQCPNGLFCDINREQKCKSCSKGGGAGECDGGFHCFIKRGEPDNECVECMEEHHCEMPKPKCTNTNQCVQCKKHEDCFGGGKCNNNECGMCSGNEHCTKAETPFCNRHTGTCEANCQQIGGNGCAARFPEKHHCNNNGHCVGCLVDGRVADCPTVDGQQYDVCINFQCGYSVTCAGFLFENANDKPLPVQKGPEVELRIKTKISHHHTSYPSPDQVPPYQDFDLSTSSLPWIAIGDPANDPHRPPVTTPFRYIYDQCKREAEAAGFSWTHVNGNDWFFSSPGGNNHNVHFNYFGKLEGKARKYLIP